MSNNWLQKILKLASIYWTKQWAWVKVNLEFTKSIIQETETTAKYQKASPSLNSMPFWWWAIRYLNK